MESIKSFVAWCLTPLATINVMEVAIDPVDDIQEIGKLLIQIALAAYGIYKLWRDNKSKK